MNISLTLPVIILSIYCMKIFSTYHIAIVVVYILVAKCPDSNDESTKLRRYSKHE